MIRQGDVLLIPVPAVPAGCKPHNAPIALGEATGHHHTVIDGDVMIADNGTMYVTATDSTELRHATKSGVKADHDWLRIPAGTYEVRIEEDYTPEGLKRVAD